MCFRKKNSRPWLDLKLHYSSMLYKNWAKKNHYNDVFFRELRAVWLAYVLIWWTSEFCNNSRVWGSPLRWGWWFPVWTQTANQKNKKKSSYRQVMHSDFGWKLNVNTHLLYSPWHAQYGRSHHRIPDSETTQTSGLIITLACFQAYKFTWRIRKLLDF